MSARGGVPSAGRLEWVPCDVHPRLPPVGLLQSGGVDVAGYTWVGKASTVPYGP